MDIVIISKDENSKTIEYIINKFSDYKIYLISPKAEKSVFNNIEKINDNDILDFNKLKKKLSIYRFGWYYQQFLKYSVVLKLKGENFLILDGDTIIREKLLKSNSLFFSTKKPDERYYSLYKNIFPNDFLSNKSFITNQMVFNKSILQNLINEIELKFEDNWISSISNLIKKNKNLMFSEYQTYTEFVLNRYNNFTIKSVKVFRRMDLISDSIENALKKYDVIAYENHHKTGFLRKLRAILYYKIGKNLG